MQSNTFVKGSLLKKFMEERGVYIEFIESVVKRQGSQASILAGQMIEDEFILASDFKNIIEYFEHPLTIKMRECVEEWEDYIASCNKSRYTATISKSLSEDFTLITVGGSIETLYESDVYTSLIDRLEDELDSTFSYNSNIKEVTHDR